MIKSSTDPGPLQRFVSEVKLWPYFSPECHGSFSKIYPHYIYNQHDMILLCSMVEYDVCTLYLWNNYFCIDVSCLACYLKSIIKFNIS